MKFLTVAAAIFVSTSLAVPNPNYGGGACIPKSRPGPGGNPTGPGGNPTGPGGNPTGPGGNPTGPGGNPTGSMTTTTSNTGSTTSTGPATTSTWSPPPTGEYHCPAGLYSNLQCCSTDVLGVLDLDCKVPSRTPTSGDDFRAICAAVGKEAKCCAIPVAGQDVLCQDAIPGGNPPGGNPPGGNPPGGNPPGGEFQCPAGLYSNAQCCATDVLGVADLDCKVPSRTPTSGDDFRAICAATGKEAKCCVLPVAGQSVLCQDAIPGGNPPSSNPPGGNPPGGNPPGGNPPPSDNGPVCPRGLYSNPQCCATDVLGVADLDCSTPSTASGPGAFKAACAAVGKGAKCCVLPVAGQSVLCQDAIGTN